MERISRPALVRICAVFSPIMINAIYIVGGLSLCSRWTSFPHPCFCYSVHHFLQHLEVRIIYVNSK